MTIWNDEHTFKQPVTFAAEVTFSETPPEISLDNLSSLTGSGTCTFADLVATDDLTVGDDAAIGGDLAVTGTTTLAAASCTTLAASSNATVGGTLGISGATTCAALTASGTVTTSGTLDVNGALDLAGATITMPTNHFLVKRYVSDAVATGGLTGATQGFAIASEPTSYVPIAAYVLITGTPASGGDTNALFVRVGTDAVPGLYSSGTSGAEVLGDTGRVALTVLPGVRGTDALKVFLTARVEPDSDGDLADITGLTSIKFVLYYCDVAAE